MNMNFIPFLSVGVFKLDDEVKNYTDTLSSFFHRPLDEYGDEYYHLSEPYSEQDNLSIRVSDGKIRTFFCYKELIYKGVNLIGLTIDEFKQVMKTNFRKVEEMDIYDDEPPEYVYAFDDIGCQVWTHYEHIVAIIPSGYWSYSEDD